MSVDIENPQQLLDYLRAEQHIAATETPTMKVLAGGVSNRTVLVERENDQNWVLKQALSKLRVKVDWFSDPQRVHREALGLRWLQQLAPPGTIPEFLFEDFEQHIIAMAAVPQPHSNWKTQLLNGDLQLDHVTQFGELLASVHSQAYQRRNELPTDFDDRGYFESLRLEPYYSYAASQVPDARSFIEDLIKTTRSLQLTLVHGDYSPKNILVHNAQLILLDHEVIHFGDPGFDIGFGSTHLLSKAHHLSQQRDEFATAAKHFWQTYKQALGPLPWLDELDTRAAQHTLACLLARVAGRSPLEYLDADDRERQQRVVLSLIVDTPQTMNDLIDSFISALANS